MARFTGHIEPRAEHSCHLCWRAQLQDLHHAMSSDTLRLAFIALQRCLHKLCSSLPSLCAHIQPTRPDSASDAARRCRAACMLRLRSQALMPALPLRTPRQRGRRWRCGPCRRMSRSAPRCRSLAQVRRGRRSRARAPLHACPAQHSAPSQSNIRQYTIQTRVCAAAPLHAAMRATAHLQCAGRCGTSTAQSRRASLSTAEGARGGHDAACL